jgi:hypothetical protein
VSKLTSLMLMCSTVDVDHMKPVDAASQELTSNVASLNLQRHVGIPRIDEPHAVTCTGSILP